MRRLRKEALAFQGAAGNAGSLFFWFSSVDWNLPMRAPLLFAAALALAGCGNNDQTDNAQNIDDNLTARNIVSNDVTAIDAVTADAANMAADVEFNDVDNSLDTDGNEPAPAKPAAKPAPSKPAPEAVANAAGNATD
jgi:hypothetical protein